MVRALGAVATGRRSRHARSSRRGSFDSVCTGHSPIAPPQQVPHGRPCGQFVAGRPGCGRATADPGSTCDRLARGGEPKAVGEPESGSMTNAARDRRKVTSEAHQWVSPRHLWPPTSRLELPPSRVDNSGENHRQICCETNGFRGLYEMPCCEAADQAIEKLARFFVMWHETASLGPFSVPFDIEPWSVGTNRRAAPQLVAL
jgi:hypothetical protein